MNKRSYKKQIAIMLALFALAPSLIFMGTFYKSIYKNRINNYMIQKEVKMDIKLNKVKDEIMHYGNIVRKVANNLSFYNQNYRDKFDYLNIVTKEECEKLFVNYDDIDYLKDKNKYLINIDKNGSLYIAYPIDSYMGRKYLIGKVSSLESLYTNYVLFKDTDIAILQNGKVLYKSEGIKSASDEFLNGINYSMTHISKSENARNYIGFKSDFLGYGISFVVLKVDDFSDSLKHLYQEYIIKILIIIIISSLIVYFLSLELNQPLNDITTIAKEIIEDKRNLNDIEIKDESSELKRKFNATINEYKRKKKDLEIINIELKNRYNDLLKKEKDIKDSLEYLNLIKIAKNESKEKNNALIDNTKEMVIFLDQEGFINYVNNSVLIELNCKKNSLIGKCFFDIFTKYEEVELDDDEFQNKFFKGENKDLKLYFKCEENEKKRLSVNTSRIFDNGEIAGILVVAHVMNYEEKLIESFKIKNRECEILNKITLYLSGSIDLQMFLEKIIIHISEILDFEICTIRLRENGDLVIKAGYGELLELFHQNIKNFKTRYYFDTLDFEKQEVIKMEELIDENSMDDDGVKELFLKLYEIIMVPLKIKDKAIGSIAIGVDKEFDRANIKVIRAIANQISIGIEKIMIYDRLKKEYLNTISALVAAIELKDEYTKGHSSRVSNFSKLLGEEMGLDELTLEELEIAGILHDIGKIGVRDDILVKDGKLTEEEYEIIKTHVTHGKAIVDPIGLSQNIVDGIYLHHKRYDLKGYPEDVQIDELGLYPAIIGVADALDAITSERTYSDKESLDVALGIISVNSGTQFHPKVVDALFRLVDRNRQKLEKLMV